MASLKTNATLLLLSSIVFIGLRSDASTEIRVLSPSEFDVVLPPEENGTLLYIRIGINKDIGFGGYEPDYEKENVIGGVIHFSEKALSLKRGDIIYYSMMFDGGNGELRGQTGNYIFNGAYKGKNRLRREVYETSSEESSEEEESSLDYSRQPRHRPPHNHFRPHGPPRHPFGPRRLGPPPFGPPHHPSPFPGPGPWKDHGYNHKDQFGNRGPWDDSNEEEDFESFGTKNKRPGSKDPNDRRPWHGGNGGNPYANNGNGNKNDKPDKGTGPANENPSPTTDSSKSDNKNNKATGNPNVEIFNSSSTAVPDIDIRYRKPEDS